MNVLGIETSCDETGIAIYNTNHGLLAHQIYSQIDLHAPFGGVVPELASRDHVGKLIPLLKQTLKAASLTLRDIDGIAYTKGPGLIGALLVGAMFGRSLAFSLNVPAIGVHHLEGHLLAAFLEKDATPTFPFLALLVSGGHTELVDVKALGDYAILGETLDDAVGEAFDKTAKLLGLAYPGGAQLAALAKDGNPSRFHFPRPMVDRAGLDFSFSGLKTYALRTVQDHQLDAQTKADIAYAFQKAIVDTLTIKTKRALLQTKYRSLVIAGGVGANVALREKLKELCEAEKCQCYFPSPIFCTDNGAMIAYAGAKRLLAGERDDLSVDVRPRWPLDEI